MYDMCTLFQFKIIIIFMIIHSNADPCQETPTEVTDLSKRAPSFIMDSVPLCDRLLVEGWYRASGYVMTTTAPSLGTCGTLYPYWLDGSLPGDGIQSTVDICQVGFSDSCSVRDTIDVKNCGGEYFYKLKPVSTCNAAYCFERNENCISSTPTDVRVHFHSMAWDENVIGIITQYDPYLNLICNFTPLPDNDIIYHIDWYIDTSLVLSGQTVTKATKALALLSAKDMTSKGKKIQTSVHCVIGAKKTQLGLPCNTTSSSTFFVGIEILTPALTIERGSSTKLQIRMTVPYGEETLSINGAMLPSGDLNVQLDFPDSIISSCAKGSVNLCDIKIPGYSYSEKDKYDDPANWYKIYELDVYNKDNIGFDLSTNLLTLRMSTKKSTNGIGSKIFENVALNDIPIKIVENNEIWKGRYCSSLADPHMTTFDGQAYECQAAGCIIDKTYILYKNENFRQEIQVKHSTCWSATCICAVAVRAGKDVFTFDACNKKILINFPICTEKSLKVVEEGTTFYKIYLPTGTYISLNLVMSSVWYINAYVYPSVADVGNTAGLCGTLDDNTANDFERRYTGAKDDPSLFNYCCNHPNDFTNSWRLNDGSSEDLFSMSQAEFDSLMPLDTKYHLCACNQGITECSYQQFTDCKTAIRGRQYPCLLHNRNNRRKRDLEVFSKRKTGRKTFDSHERVKRQISGYTEEQATTICNSVFSQSVEYTTCEDNVPSFNNESLANCIMDLQLTGDQNLTQMHLEEALRQCTTFIVLNGTLQTEKPDVAYQITSLCQNNCSGNGVCSEGNCTCDSGFGGSDCSFDTGAPPNIDYISGGGLCDKSEDDCNDITIYGGYFISNMGARCFFRRQDLMINGTILTQEIYTENLEDRTLVEGYCPLSYPTNSGWITQFEFNISSDGIRFTDTYTVYVYQSTCQVFNNDTGTVNFTMIDGTCFIDGLCVVNGAKAENDNCSVCNSASDRFNWTYNYDCNSSTTETTATSFTTAPSTNSTSVTPTTSIATSTTSTAATTISTAETTTSTEAPTTSTSESTTSTSGSSSSTSPTPTTSTAAPSTSTSGSTTSSSTAPTTSTAAPTTSTSGSTFSSSTAPTTTTAAPTTSTSGSTSSSSTAPTTTTAAPTTPTSGSTTSTSGSTSSSSTAPTTSTAAPTNSTSGSTSSTLPAPTTSTTALTISTSATTNSTVTSTTKATTASSTIFLQSSTSTTGSPIIQTTHTSVTNSTTKVLRDTGNDQSDNNKTTVIALAVASGIAGLAVLVTAAMIIKTKFFNGQSSPMNAPNVHEDGAQQDNVLAENTSPGPEILFENVEHDHISRPPTATTQHSEGVRPMSATNDFRHVLDDMFTASKYK